MDLIMLIVIVAVASLFTMMRGESTSARVESLATTQVKSDFVIEELPFCGPAIKPQKCFTYYQEVLHLCR